MKNIKEITISILIIISFYTVITSVFEDEPSEAVWELHTTTIHGSYTINKVTGEVRFHLPEDGKIKTIK
jgi:hypothetical protein